MIKKPSRDYLILIFITVSSFLLFSRFDVLEKIVQFSQDYESFEIDEILSTSIVLVFGLLWFTFKKKNEMFRLNQELEKTTKELEKAMSEIKSLKGILPLCSYCKKIRNDSGYWEQVDVYLQKHSELDISHSLCPECLKEHYPDISKELKKVR